MKRDMDLIRLILLMIEENPEPDIDGYLQIPGYTEGQLLYHQHLLMEAGYLTAIEAKDANTRYGFYLQNAKLTWIGHEFLEGVRDKKIWSETKKTAGKIGNWSIGFISEIAKGIARQKLVEHGFDIG